MSRSRLIAKPNIEAKDINVPKLGAVLLINTRPNIKNTVNTKYMNITN